MAFSVLLSITVILTVSFVVTKKNLHLFEIVFMWMVTIIIDHNFLTITAVNMRMFDFAERPANHWALALMRIFLIPLLITWYFDKTFSVKSYKKWAWLPFAILIFIGVEYLGDVLNVYRHSRWKVWWSPIEWFVIFLLVNYSWLLYRKLLRREMQ